MAALPCAWEYVLVIEMNVTVLQLKIPSVCVVELFKIM